MLIESKNEYIPSLTRLWNEVFGDSEDYIDLFFRKAYYDCECFAELDGEKIISAFYLLKSSIRVDEKTYNGRYLYAAATLPEYRGKGLMSKLINEAVAYGEKEKLDFIALVPANDGLYDYYGRFGFKESMYKYMTEISLRLKDCSVITDAEDFGKIRNTSSCNMMVYNKIGTEYSFDCLKFSGADVLAVSDSVYYIDDEELFVSGDCLYPADIFGESNEDRLTVYTNYPFENAVKVRNGMMYNFRNDFEFKDIYMNIALD